MRIWLWEYAFWVMGICILVMLGYGHDESAPTPDGVFAPYFVGVRWCFAECSPRYRRPSAAVGADLSCPRIRKYTRNGGRICLFGNANMCNW